MSWALLSFLINRQQSKCVEGNFLVPISPPPALVKVLHARPEAVIYASPAIFIFFR